MITKVDSNILTIPADQEHNITTESAHWHKISFHDFRMRLRKQGQIDAKFTKRFVVAFGVVTYLVELAAADRDAPATATAPPPNAVRFRRRRPTSATPQLRQVPPPSASPCAPRHRCTQALPARRGVARCCLVLKTAAEVSALAIAGRRGSSGFGFTMRTTTQMHRAGGVPGAPPAEGNLSRRGTWCCSRRRR